MNMNCFSSRIFVALLTFTLGVAATSIWPSHEEKGQVSREPAASGVRSCADGLRQEVEPKLRAVLPRGWSLSAAGKTFVLTRGERLWVYNPVNMPNKRPDQIGIEKTYTVTLRFEPLLTGDEYQRLKAARAPYEEVVNEGAPSAWEWSAGVEEFHRHEVPVYFTEKYSIYAEKSDSFPLRVYPEPAAAECRRLIDALDGLFTRYEPWTDKYSDF